MTLEELTGRFWINVCQEGQAIIPEDGVEVYRIINDATHHVAMWLSALGARHMLTEWTGTISNPEDVRHLHVTPDGFYNRVLKILDGERTPTVGVAETEDRSLEIVDWLTSRPAVPTSPAGRPQLYVHNEQIGLLRPADQIEIKVTFVHGLPDMTLSTDMPGQQGGDGTPNVIPIDFQHLIPSYAAILYLAGERETQTAWERIFSEQKQTIIGALGLRGKMGLRSNWQ